MMNEQAVNTKCNKVISWQAVIAGALVAIGLIFLFTLLTTGLGLSLMSKSEAGLVVLTVVGFLWLLIGVFILLFIAGWITGRLASKAHPEHCGNGMLHGFIAWVLYLLITLIASVHSPETTLSVLSVSMSSMNANSAATTESNNTATSETSQAHKNGLGTLGIFFIFLGGAVGSCFGAASGMGARKGG